MLNVPGSHDLLAPDVAHVVSELEVQLAALSQEAAALRNNSSFTEDASRALACIDRSIAVMRRVILDALDLKELETGTLRLDRRPIELCSLVETVVARMDARDRLRLAARSVRSLHVMADERRLARAIEALLRSALGCAVAGAPLIVRLDRHPDRASLSVDAVGTFAGPLAEQILHRNTVPATDWDADQLAIYVARETLAAHGGTLGVDSIAQLGARLFLELPLVQAA
jgi:two-component system CheB/CheR fusion protein